MNTFIGRPEAVVFDLDGTLIDTADEFVVVLQHMLAAHNKPQLPAALIRKSVSNGSGALVSLAFDVTPADDDYEPLRLAFLDRYAHVLGSSAAPYPGMRALVNALAQQRIPWGVATNKFRRYAQPLMAAMDFVPPAGSLVTPCDVTEPKPHPEAILLSCENLGAKPSGTLYIGDHRRDIDAGRNAGCFTIAAAYGYLEDGDDPRDWQADAIAHTSEGLAAMIMRMIE
jgi:2-phosphoglycolate phosphatase